MKKLIVLLMMMASTLVASIGEVTALKGEASLVRAGKTDTIMIGTKLEEHDEIITGKKSKLQIVFEDKTVISLGQKSHFKVDEYIFTEKKVSAKFSVGKGFFKSITGKIGKISPKQFKIKTANATIGVRGTTIIGEVSKKRDIIACSFGQIMVTTEQGTMLVNAGERTIVETAKAPRPSEKVNKVILKQLEQKSSSPRVEENAPSVPTVEVAVKQEDKKEEVTQVEDEKSAKKFEPWIEDTGLHSLDDIKEIIGENNPTYSGKIVEGSTSLYGAIDKDSSAVQLGFDLGTGKMDGDIKFQSSDVMYDIEVDGRLKGDGSFNFNSDSFEGGGSGALSGDKLEHANGDMQFIEKDFVNGDVINDITAKFETTHQK